MPRTLRSPFVVVVAGALTSCLREPPPARDAGPAVLPAPSPALPVSASSAPVTAVPEPVDRDQDGVPDDEDACPDQPGTMTYPPDRRGCRQLVMIGPANPPPPVVVRFEGDSTVPSKSSEAELDAAAVVMKDHPGIALLRIEGHDDPSSGAKKALALSRARAEAVVKALTQRGVDKSRLRAVGLGGYCPLAPSQTPDDRAKNRRAEFRVETSDEGLTAPEVGCPPSRNAGIR